MIYASVFLISLLFRYLPQRNQILDFDTHGHMYFATAIRQQSLLPWEEVKLNCWASDKIRNPFLWNWIVGMTGLDKLPRQQKYFNCVIDAFFCLLIFAIGEEVLNSRSDALIVTLLYLFTPLWFSCVSMGTRLNSCTPRLFSEICLCLFFILTLIELNLPFLVTFFLASFLVGVIASSSKFGLQAIIFLVPTVAFLDDDLSTLLTIPLGIGLLIVISKGQFIHVIKYTFSGALDYFRRNKKGQMQISYRNSFKLIFYTNHGKRRNLKDIIWRMVAVNSYTGTLIKLPLILPLFFLYFWGAEVQSGSPEHGYGYPVLAALLAFLLINRPSLLFLGEAERYINHVNFFVCLFFFDLAKANGATYLVWLTICYGICFWIFELIYFAREQSTKLIVEADDQIEEYLQNAENQLTVTTFPYHNFCIYKVMRFQNHKALFPLLISPEKRKAFTERFEPQYPFIDLHKLDEISQQTGLNCVIVNKKVLANSTYSGWQPGSNWKRRTMGQQIYTVYEKL